MFRYERVYIGRRTKSEIYEKQKGRCNYCGRKLDINYLHIDHKSPVSRDGGDNPGNLQLLCPPCNSRKGDLTDGEFRRVYHLTPSRKAKNPPSILIPQSYFNKISKERAKRRRNRDDGFSF